MKVSSALFAACRILAALLLPVLPARDACQSCKWVYKSYDVVHKDGECCFTEWEEVKVYYCNVLQYTYEIYYGYYCYNYSGECYQ